MSPVCSSPAEAASLDAFKRGGARIIVALTPVNSENLIENAWFGKSTKICRSFPHRHRAERANGRGEHTFLDHGIAVSHVDSDHRLQVFADAKVADSVMSGVERANHVSAQRKHRGAAPDACLRDDACHMGEGVLDGDVAKGVDHKVDVGHECIDIAFRLHFALNAVKSCSSLIHLIKKTLSGFRL